MNFHHTCIVEILTDDGAGPRINLVNHRNTIGRHGSCTVQIGGADPRVSNRHAVIMLDGNGVSIEDLGSTNGVFVNGDKTLKAYLNHHDIVRFGLQGPRIKIIIEKQSSDAAGEQSPPLLPRTVVSATEGPDSLEASSSSVGNNSGNDASSHLESPPSGIQKKGTTEFDLHQPGIDEPVDARIFDVSNECDDFDQEMPRAEIDTVAEPRQYIRMLIDQPLEALPARTNRRRQCSVEILTESGVYRRVELVNHRNTFGRNASCTVVIGDGDHRVSNRHAEIILDRANVSIADLGSTNGVYVNGQKTDKADLKHHDIVRFGVHGPRVRIVMEKHGSHEAASVVPPPVQLRVEEHTAAGSDIFDVSPSSSVIGNGGGLDAASGVGQQPEIRKKGVSDSDRVQPMADKRDDDRLFDLSPENGDIGQATPMPEIGSTVEIKKRLRDQIMNTQDIKVLAKNHRMREKIISDQNIGEPEKQIINRVTKAYSSMKRKNLVIFGTIIALLCGCIIWFAYGYFSYKNEISRLMSLKDKIARYDDKFEKARSEPGVGSSAMKQLYDSLQKVQSQYDSIKGKLDVKDRNRIYTDTVEAFLDEIMNEFNEKNYCIPVHMLERVKYYIYLFTNDQRRSTEILMRRRGVFFPEIERVFTTKNVPKILGYVAMQESLLDSNARSQVGALGMWQFMESTGRKYNLTITDSVDERKDWRRATMAAASYFRSLIVLFGDGRGILLAIAAYNAGEQKINRALENIEDPIRDRDFWYLYRTSSTLALETREYVPQVLARIIIDKHPDLYGFASKN